MTTTILGLAAVIRCRPNTVTKTLLVASFVATIPIQAVPAPVQGGDIFVADGHAPNGAIGE
jgi:hypothetical protein